MKNIKITSLIFLVIGIAIIAFFIITKPTSTPTSAPTPDQVFCTQEAKLCPDGSYVSRTGPQCQFSACPTNTVTPTTTITPTPTPTTTTPKTTSGITGIVLLGPTCPVMREPPEPECADKLYKTALVVTTPDGSRIIKKFSSDMDGKFKVNLPPGEYLVQSSPTTTYPLCSSDGNVIVKAGMFTDTAVSCYTGIL